MKKSFLLGVLAGCVFTMLLCIGYYKIAPNYFSRRANVSTEVQEQIAANIQDTKKLVDFAERSLAEYASILQESREFLLKSNDGKYSFQEKKREIARRVERGLRVIETARFNTIPLFVGDNGEGSRVIPVTLDATTPSYRLSISSSKYNRSVISTFIGNLATEITLENNIAELDRILSQITLERAQLDAYQCRLTHSVEIAFALSKSNLNERKKELAKIQYQMETEQLLLSVQSANGIYNSEDRQHLQIKFTELNDELARIRVLLKGSESENHDAKLSLRTQSDAEQAMLYLADR